MTTTAMMMMTTARWERKLLHKAAVVTAGEVACLISHLLSKQSH